jgi:hypothetical protein
MKNALLTVVASSSALLAGCGGSAATHAAAETPTAFNQRVQQLCTSLVADLRAIPGPIERSDVLPYFDGTIAVEQRDLKRFSSLRPPPSIATSYDRLVGILGQELSGTVDLAALLRAHNLAAFGAALGRNMQMSRQQNAQIVELAFQTCAGDAEPRTWIVHNDADRFTARLQTACSPAVEQGNDATVDEIAVLGQARAHRMPAENARADIARDLVTAGAAAIDAANRLAALHVGGAPGADVSGMTAAIRATGTLIQRTGQQAATSSSPAGLLANLQSSLPALDRQLGRYGGPLRATQCTQL